MIASGSLEENIFVRSCTIAYVQLSSNALYATPLGILALSVTSYLGGMAIAEDILRGDPCDVYFQDQLRFPKRRP